LRLMCTVRHVYCDSHRRVGNLKDQKLFKNKSLGDGVRVVPWAKRLLIANVLVLELVVWQSVEIGILVKKRHVIGIFFVKKTAFWYFFQNSSCSCSDKKTTTFW